MDRWKSVGDFDGHTHGRTGAALFVPAPPRLGGASNLLENQINLAAGRRTLSPSFFSSARSSVVLLLPPSGIALLLSSLGISRTRANRRHGTEGGGGEEGGGPEVLRATDTDPEARREGGAATKSFGLLAAAVAGP